MTGIIVIDSVTALTPKAEIEGETGESKMGLQARLISQALRKLTAVRPNIEGVAMARRLVLPFDDRQTFYRAG